MDPDARKFLTQEMLRFFDNKEYAKPGGYVAAFKLTPLQFLFNTRPILIGQIAQLVEQRTENPRVGGSIPSLATTLRQPLMLMSHLGHTGVSHGVYSQTKTIAGKSKFVVAIYRQYFQKLSDGDL